MTKIIALAAITFVAVPSVQAQSLTDALCGSGHRNEVVSLQDVIPNTGGYYIASLRVQLSYGDPRIVNPFGEVFHLCTSSAATPDLEATRALHMKQTREVRYLFVPEAPDPPETPH